MKYEELYYRDLKRLNKKAIKIIKDNFNKKTSIDSRGKQIWWKNNIIGSFNTIRIENPLFTITTDASTIGLGAVFKNTYKSDQFSITETLMHINVLELKTILCWLRSLYDHICESDIKVLSDNTTAVHCVNNMVSCRYADCDKITKSIWNWAIKRRL